MCQQVRFLFGQLELLLRFQHTIFNLRFARRQKSSSGFRVNSTLIFILIASVIEVEGSIRVVEWPVKGFVEETELSVLAKEDDVPAGNSVIEEESAVAGCFCCFVQL